MRDVQHKLPIYFLLVSQYPFHSSFLQIKVYLYFCWGFIFLHTAYIFQRKLNSSWVIEVKPQRLKIIITPLSLARVINSGFMLGICLRNWGMIFFKFSEEVVFLVFSMWHEWEKREAWWALWANIEPQGQIIAKSGANTKEAEMWTRERKAFWLQHLNCQSKHFPKEEK